MRSPAVAGQFYPSDKDELYELIHWCFTSSVGPGKFPSQNSADNSEKISKTECLVVPHAGYIYSGPVAAFSYKIAFDFFRKFQAEREIIVVILGPNHYGIGSGVAVPSADFWETPLGRVRIAKDLRKKLVESSAIIDTDDLAHSREHSIEVQIPFIQAMAGNQVDKVAILPICLMLQDIETATELGNSLAKIANVSGVPMLLLGSSDLTHYEPHEVAVRQDHALLNEIEKVAISPFYGTLERRNITACGYGAIASVMGVSKHLQKQKGSLLKYATSGDTSGDKSSVVGYASVRFSND